MKTPIWSHPDSHFSRNSPWRTLGSSIKHVFFWLNGWRIWVEFHSLLIDLSHGFGTWIFINIFQQTHAIFNRKKVASSPTGAANSCYQWARRIARRTQNTTGYLEVQWRCSGDAKTSKKNRKSRDIAPTTSVTRRQCFPVPNMIYFYGGFCTSMLV